MSLVLCHWSLVIGHWSLVLCPLSLVIGDKLYHVRLIARNKNFSASGASGASALTISIQPDMILNSHLAPVQKYLIRSVRAINFNTETVKSYHCCLLPVPCCLFSQVSFRLGARSQLKGCAFCQLPYIAFKS
ncbi:MAG: hypothetical protein F6K31_24735 [Symploca sp. SIO2G7]|nr:hypothetical protein [Symploca sp. SIO2G7]